MILCLILSLSSLNYREEELVEDLAKVVIKGGVALAGNEENTIDYSSKFTTTTSTNCTIIVPNNPSSSRSSGTDDGDITDAAVDDLISPTTTAVISP